MGIRQKLILSFMLISLLGASLGVIAIWSNQQLINQLVFKEKPTRFAIQAANDISTEAKWAERYLYLFLTLHHPDDRDKFYKKMLHVDERIAFVEQQLSHQESEDLMAAIKSQTKSLLDAGTRMIEIYDKASAKKHRFRSEKYQDEIFNIHDVTNHLRSRAVHLANTLTDILNRQLEHNAANNVSYHAEEAEAHLMLYLLLDDILSRDLFFSGVKAVGDQIAILKRHVHSAKGKLVLQDMVSEKQQMLVIGNALLAKYDQGRKHRTYFSAQQNQQQITAFHKVSSALRKLGVELEKIKIQQEQKPRQNMLQKAQVFNYTVFTIVCGVFILSILLGLWLAIGLSRSSKRLQAAARQVGKGNLDVAVDSRGKDEFGLLAQTFNQMIIDLKQARQKLAERNEILNEEIDKRKEIEKKLQEQATTDPLTGIPNRRAFFEKAQKEQLRSFRYQRKMAVLMLDLDHFKAINDNYGHRGGDEILKIFAREAVKPLRTSDLIGRVGGEEFAIILPETDLQRAVKIAERIRHRIENIQVPVGGLMVQFTVSIGVSEIIVGEKDINAALNRADKALYKAKRTGRNRVCQKLDSVEDIASNDVTVSH